MDISESLNIWRRRSILTTALLAMALAGAAAAVTGLPRTYQADSTVIMLASRSAARLNGGNPYLSFSPSLTLTADALSRGLMAQGTVQQMAARGFSDPYTVALAPYTTTTTGSILLVSVTGSSRLSVERTLTAVTDEIGTTLARLQSNVSARNKIRALTLAFSSRATLSISQTARPLVAIILPGFLLALAIPLIVDGWIARRRIRKRAAHPEGSAHPKGSAHPEGSAGPGDQPANSRVHRVDA
jgi:hypothetical protein